MRELDLLDQQIIVELRRDGRLTNTEIARRLGVSEATIRSRLHRLTSAGIIRVAAAVNLTRLGYNVHVIIGVKCDVDRIPHVMRGLADVSEVRMVSAVSGRWEMLVTASFRSRKDLLSFLTDCLGVMPGVHKAEALHVLREVKRDSYYWETQPLPMTASKDASAVDQEQDRAEADSSEVISDSM
jgi:Lrp/AsnC family transcriptional regulator, regulator for asnA, asnC and gidA